MESGDGSKPREAMGSEKILHDVFIDERSVQPSRDDVLPFLVCPAVEAMSRAPHPWLILNPANETERGPRARPLSAAHQTR
jgi:hypothetical protein